MATKTDAAPGSANLVAEVEEQLGDKLAQARAAFDENVKERDRLQKKHAGLTKRQGELKADHRKLLVDHGKGVKGAAEKRGKVESELADVNSEIEAVDAAIAYESERSVPLQTALKELEAQLEDARKRQIQAEIATELTAKKEAFISAFTSACTLLAETVKLADRLLAAEGKPFLDQALEDLLFRTNRGVLIDSFKFTEVQSGLGLAQRIFEVKALVPPSPSPETA